MSSIVNSMVNTSNEFNQALSKQKGSALDKDAFMLLLVTQFKYQDPLNPMEDKEFIAQLAQFSSLEQLMNMNDSMKGLTDATLSGQMINATSYIGKNVDATGTNVSKTTDKDNKVSVSTFRYAIGETAVTGTINIYDGSGGLVNSYTMPSQMKGTYPFEWDGKGISGAYAPDGVYRIVPLFTNAEGKNIQYDAVVDGRVNGVITENGMTYLTLEDGRNVALANVRRVTEPQAKGTDDKDKPGDGTDKPGDGTDKPGDGTDKPGGGDGVDKPGDGGDTGGTPPDAGGTPPDSGGTPPATGDGTGGVETAKAA